MAQYELIGSFVKLKSFAPVVDLQWAESFGEKGGLNLIDSYIVTDELAAHFERVLESFTLKRHERKALMDGNIVDTEIHPRAYILWGQYGTGKSYFLLMMSALLESLGNDELFKELYEKFGMFDGISFHMNCLEVAGAKYMLVRIDGVKNADMHFNELVQKKVAARIQAIINVSSKFAQNERTIFSFCADTVSKKLREPVIRDGRLNLVTTGDIYNYFIDTISERNAILKDSAMRCLSFCKTELEKDVIKALVIAYVSAGEGSDSRLSPKDTAFILGVDDIRQIDMFLKEMSANPASNTLLVRDWEALKGYLEKGFEDIAASNAGEAIRLLEGLSKHINSFLLERDASVKQQEAETKARKKIAFSRLFAEINSEILNSGYKIVTMDDFARVLLRIIDRAKKEYDDVDIDDQAAG